MKTASKEIIESNKKTLELDSHIDILAGKNEKSAIPKLIDDFLVYSDNNYELGNKFDILEVNLETIKGNTNNKIYTLFTKSPKISKGPKQGELNNIQLGKTILHFRREDVDYKIRVSKISINEDIPGTLIIEGIDEKKTIRYTSTKVVRNPIEQTGYFL